MAHPLVVGCSTNNPNNRLLLRYSTLTPSGGFIYFSLKFHNINFNWCIKEIGNVGGNKSTGMTTEIKINRLKHLQSQDPSLQLTCVQVHLAPFCLTSLFLFRRQSRRAVSLNVSLFLLDVTFSLVKVRENVTITQMRSCCFSLDLKKKPKKNLCLHLQLPQTTNRLQIQQCFHARILSEKE